MRGTHGQPFEVVVVRRCLVWLVSFFSPLPGWKDRVRRFSAGQLAWPLPHRTDAPKVGPFPPEWTAVKLLPIGEGHPRGWENIEVICTDCGGLASAAHGVRCARCGTFLHEGCAGLVLGNEVPACVICEPRVRFLERGR